MNIDSVRLVSGEKVALRAVKGAKGGGHTGAMTGGIVATSLVFWPAAPFFLFMHGKDITIPKGTEITAYINGNAQLDASNFQSGGQVQATSRPANTSPPGTVGSLLDVSSSPPGADIEIDGSFVGNTPSSVGVTPGEHTIRLSKDGYQDWERKIKSSTGNVKLTATLSATSRERSSVPSTIPLVVSKTAQNQTNATNAEAVKQVVNGPNGVSDVGILMRMLGIQAVEWEQGGEEGGALITEVAREGVARSAGLESGNVITSIDGKAVRTPLELASELAKRAPGSRVRLGCLFRSTVLGWMPSEKIVTLQASR